MDVLGRLLLAVVWVTPGLGEGSDNVVVPDLFRWTDMMTHKHCLSPSAEAKPAFRPPLQAPAPNRL